MRQMGLAISISSAFLKIKELVITQKLNLKKENKMKTYNVKDRSGNPAP